MKKGKFKQLIFAFLLFAATASLYGQSGSAVIVYAEGDGFTLVRDGETSFYEVDYDDVLGMLLYKGDTILTEEDTFLEIQVTSNASLIKIAENTTFAFERIGNSGGGTISVAYGRIRAKINKLTDEDKFEVMGSGTTAGVRGTDFGYDLTFGENFSADETNEAITSVYCFEGAVQVLQEDKETREIKEVLIETDQMVVTSTGTTDEPLVVYQIDQEIDRFWEENKFVYQMIEKEDAQVVALSDGSAEDDYYTAKIFGEKRRLERSGGGLTLAGILLAGGGTAAYSLMDEKSLGIGMISVGAASFISGLILLINSSTLPDPPDGWVPPPEKNTDGSEVPEGENS
ncbi:FecR family protein [Spirochaeta isovalerica]|uniref:FecR protein domain-containing protein n=1 Tax=Spirochaeta isovalerica TaxID=150 RepID=A0A841RGN6_9SPIO|nr:FecR family protein [Spirochaeta isovalerica]MBB6482551.1 hypothetical protein [Spirochaeta isovalerica]